MSRSQPGHDHSDANSETLATHMATPTAPREVRIHTIQQVAGMLGVTVADVLDLIRRGALRAKRVASSAVVSGDALADFMATHDAASRFPRFTEGQPVILVDDDGTLGSGLYAGEAAAGQVVVSRPGFLGRYEQTFAPEQVQPLTCRLPTPASH